MSSIVLLLYVFGVGILLGLFFYGGLWWSVRKGLLSKNAAFWFLGSLLVRTSVVLTGFFMVMHHNWERILPCMAGFIAGRILVTRVTHSKNKKVAAGSIS